VAAFFVFRDTMQVSTLIGRKVNQTSGFLQNGKRVPLTVVNVMGNVITQLKTTDKEGYSAIQVGLDIKKKPGKRDLNRAKQAGLEKAPRFFKEIRMDDIEGAELGTSIDIATVFAPGDIIDVTGTSKGKGWAGGVKRHGFHGGPRTHGQSDRERAPGSIGQTTTPGRVYKGKRMAGRMGTDTVTVKNLEIIEITADGVLLIKGLVPGNLNGYLTIKKVGENKKFVPLYKENTEEDSGIASESSPVSEDASQTNADEQSSEPAQLSESKPSDPNDNQKIKPESALDSSENVQTSPTASTEPEQAKEEAKKEVVQDAKS